MASSGRISVLITRELQILLQAMKEIPRELAKAVRVHTQREAAPIWQESVRGHVTDRMQTRILSDTARVAVTDSNVLLKSGAVGTMANGTPKSLLAAGTEFGADPNFTRSVTNAQGTTFTRHTKRQFRRPRSGGHVVYPAARDSVPRLASLWVQTAIRSVMETIERSGGAR